MVPLGRCPELGILSHGDASADTASDLHVTQPQCTVLRDAVADAEWAEGLGSDEWGRGGGGHCPLCNKLRLFKARARASPML